MNFDLKTPCKDCPFLQGKSYLNPDRAYEIAEYTVQDNTMFSCHKTLASKKGEQHCAGALIMAEKRGLKGNMLQVAQRLGFYDPAKLDMAAPIYESAEAMRAGHARAHSE